MIKKPIIYGLSNKGKRNAYIIEKNSSFIPLFANFLLNCGFKNNQYIEYSEDKSIKIDEWIDTQDNFKNEDYDIDIIFGKERIILIIRTVEENLDRVRKGINNMCDFNQEVIGEN